MKFGRIASNFWVAGVRGIGNVRTEPIVNFKIGFSLENECGGCVGVCVCGSFYGDGCTCVLCFRFVVLLRLFHMKPESINVFCACKTRFTRFSSEVWIPRNPRALLSHLRYAVGGFIFCLRHLLVCVCVRACLRVWQIEEKNNDVERFRCKWMTNDPTNFNAIWLNTMVFACGMGECVIVCVCFRECWLVARERERGEANVSRFRNVWLLEWFVLRITMQFVGEEKSGPQFDTKLRFAGNWCEISSLVL